MSDHRITSAIYKLVVDDVMLKCKPEFVTEGVDESVLVQLRALWEAKLVSTGLVVDPAAPVAPVPLQAAPTPAFQPYAGVKSEPGTWPRAAQQQQAMTHPSQGVAAGLGYAQQQMAASQQQQQQRSLQMQQQAAQMLGQQNPQQPQHHLAAQQQQLAASIAARLPRADGLGATPQTALAPFNSSSSSSSNDLDASRKRKQPDTPTPMTHQTAVWGGAGLAQPNPQQQLQLMQQLHQLQQQQMQQAHQGMQWRNNLTSTQPALAPLSHTPNPAAALPYQQQTLQQQMQMQHPQQLQRPQQPQQPLQQQQQVQHLGNGAPGSALPGSGHGTNGSSGYIPQHDGPGDRVGAGSAGPSKPAAPRKSSASAAAAGASKAAAPAAAAATAAAAAAAAAAEQAGTEELLSSDDEAEVEEEEVDNFLCGQFEKVTRAKHKWKITMKDGVFHADGKDYLFKRGTAEFVWTG